MQKNTSRKQNPNSLPVRLLTKWHVSTVRSSPVKRLCVRAIFRRKQARTGFCLSLPARFMNPDLQRKKCCRHWKASLRQEIFRMKKFKTVSLQALHKRLLRRVWIPRKRYGTVSLKTALCPKRMILRLGRRCIMKYFPRLSGFELLDRKECL